MQFNVKLFAVAAACAAAGGLLAGCSSVTRGTPVAGAVINANMTSADFEVIGTTEGKSRKTSILGPVLQIIDGNKISVLGIKFFEDQYAFAEKPSGLFTTVSVEDRAYYKALAATPDADAIAGKGFVRTRSGFPLLWSSQQVTFQGKALKYKAHK